MSRSHFSQHSHCSPHSSSSRSVEQTSPLHHSNVHAGHASADWLPLNLPIVDFIDEPVPVGVDSIFVPCASFSAPPSKFPQEALYHVFDAMELELGKCRLTAAEEQIRLRLFGDIRSMRDLILTILVAHQTLSHAAREMASHTPQCACDATKILKPAEDSIQNALSRLAWFSDRVSQRFDESEDHRQLPDGSVKSLRNWMAGFKGSQRLPNSRLPTEVAPNTLITTYETRLEEQFRSETIASMTLAITAVIFRSPDPVVAYLAREAGIPEHTSQSIPTHILDDINSLLGKLTLALQMMGSYWAGTRRAHLYQTKQTEQLLRGAEVLDKHVNCSLTMATAMRRNLTT